MSAPGTLGVPERRRQYDCSARTCSRDPDRSGADVLPEFSWIRSGVNRAAVALAPFPLAPFLLALFPRSPALGVHLVRPEPSLLWAEPSVFRSGSGVPGVQSDGVRECELSD